MKKAFKRRYVPRASAGAAPPNELPIDTAPRIDLGNGASARYGLCPANVPVDNPHNARVHSEGQIRKVQRSMAVSGALAPVVLDEGWTILAGHARVEGARRAKMATIPVVQVFGLSEAQKRAFLLADNRIGEDAGWNREFLAAQLPELTAVLEEAGYSIEDTGFEIAELDELTADFEHGSDPDDEVSDKAVSGPPVLRPGELVQLGGHRLLIGDARIAASIDQLVGQNRPAAAFLDVPYNQPAKAIGGRGQFKHGNFAFGSGELTRPEFVTFLTESLGNAARVSAPGAVHFVCIDWRHVRDVIEAGEALYGDFIDLVVWNKTIGGQGRPYRSQHELICVFRVGTGKHRDNVQMGRFGRNRSNVWTYAGMNAFGAGRMENLSAHPTVKPLRLVADAIKDCTRPGDFVLDTFVGSGTSILAAERVGRRALAMEISPNYGDVAVRRWQAATRADARLVETGQPFDALAIERAADSPRRRVRSS